MNHFDIEKPQPRVVELTDKKWKALQVIGTVVMIFGAVVIAIATAKYDERPQLSIYLIYFGGVVISLGGVGYAVSQVMAWWHHG